MNGDGLPDRVVWNSSAPTSAEFIVFFNNGHGFDLPGTVPNRVRTGTITFGRPRRTGRGLACRGFIWTLSIWTETAENNIHDEYSPGDPVVNYTYDGPYNNLKTISDPRNATYLTTFSYNIPVGDTTTDIADLFPTTVTNALGHETKKSYDPGTGNVMSVSDPNGSITRYEYDSLGRLEGEVRPDGGYTRTEYSLYQEGVQNFSYLKISEYATKADYPNNPIHESYTYLDGLGRVFKSRKTAPPNSPGEWVYTCTFFDSAGRVENSSNPVFGDGNFECSLSNGDYTRYYYDGLDRLKQTRVPDDDYGYLYMRIFYCGLRKTVYDPKNYYTHYYSDALGRLVKVINYTGKNGSFTTNYTYDLLGNLTQVATQAKSETGSYLRDIVTTMSYDSLGRKRSMADPDMGLWEYKYDLAGNLRWQRDSKGAVTTFQYDKLNRVEYKFTGEDSITYWYDYGGEGSNTIGRLAAIWSNDWVNGSYYDYIYDNMGRLVEEAFMPWWDSAYYTKKYEYNTMGQVRKVTYPDFSEISYSYLMGYLMQVVGPGGKVLAD